MCQHDGKMLSTKVAIVPILRSGLGMVDAMLDLLPQAKVHHIGKLDYTPKLENQEWIFQVSRGKMEIFCNFQ